MPSTQSTLPHMHRSTTRRLTRRTGGQFAMCIMIYGSIHVPAQGRGEDCNQLAQWSLLNRLGGSGLASSPRPIPRPMPILLRNVARPKIRQGLPWSDTVSSGCAQTGAIQRGHFDNTHLLLAWLARQCLRVHCLASPAVQYNASAHKHIHHTHVVYTHKK